MGRERHGKEAGWREGDSLPKPAKIYENWRNLAVGGFIANEINDASFRQQITPEILHKHEISTKLYRIATNSQSNFCQKLFLDHLKKLHRTA